jgi:hypothetical protein
MPVPSRWPLHTTTPRRPTLHVSGRLTMFADYRVPQILRNMNILAYSAELAARVDAREEVACGSDYETEIRASTVVCVDRIAGAYTTHLHAPNIFPLTSTRTYLPPLPHTLFRDVLHMCNRSGHPAARRHHPTCRGGLAAVERWRVAACLSRASSQNPHHLLLVMYGSTYRKYEVLRI